MSMQQASFFCPQCQQIRLFQSQPMNHVVHLLASVFLCGLWLPIWILLALGDKPMWHCAFCGYHDQQKYLANPQLRVFEAQKAQQDREAKQLRDAAFAEATAGMTFGEKSAYWITENRPTLIAVGAIAAAGGVVLMLALYQEQINRTSITAPSPTPTVSTEVDTRRYWAKSVRNDFDRYLKDIEVKAEGSDERTLLFSHKDINDGFIKVFPGRIKPFTEKLRKAGFTAIRFTNSQREWTQRL
jgi:hypothetical protein